MPETGKADAIGRARDLRAELVRAETVLQIAQQAFAAIETAYAGMQELSKLAQNDDFTEEERASLIAAFEKLKQSIDDLIDTTVFDSDRILAGGDGPDGSYVVSLFAAGESGLPFDILIPAGSATGELELANIAGFPTPDFAHSAGEAPEKAAQLYHRLGEAIDSQRSALQRIFAAEIDPDRRLGDHVETIEPLEKAEQLSRVVSEIVLAGGAIPFEKSADRMRLFLDRAHNSPHPAFSGTGSVTTGQHGVMSAPVPGNDAQQDAGPVSEAPARAQGPVHTAPTVTGSAPVHRIHSNTADNDVGLRTYEAPGEKIPADGDDPAGIEIVLPAEAGETAERHDIAISPAPAAGPTPVAVRPTVAMSVNGTAALDRTGTGLGETVKPVDGVGGEPARAAEPIALTIPGASPVAQSANPGRVSTVTQPPAQPHTKQPDTELPEDILAHPFMAVAQEFAQPGNRAGMELRQAELTRIAEPDAARRVAGPVQQARDADPRLDAGLIIARSGNETPSDPVHGFGASLPVDTGSFLAELVRADNMLHVADLSIEQIDLHLDYLRDLAEESATDPSRDRAALDDIFQAVKSDVIDALAQTTEAQGEKILSGGDGPDGDYVIRLSEGGVAGAGNDIAIPSMRLEHLSPDLLRADVRTRDAATAALAHIEFAGDDALQAREAISEQRTLIRQLLSLEISRNASRHSAA